jgi:hypothetical protein
MNLSISQILSESWEDFKKLIVNPIVLILFVISSSLSILPDFIQEDTSPLLALLIIPLVLVMLFIYAYQVKLIYNLKKGGEQNILSEVLSIYPKSLWYTLIFIGIFIVVTLVVAVPAAVLYFTMGDKAAWVLFLDIALVAVYIPIVIYLCIRLFFYAYLIIIEKDDTPLATSWAMTKNYFWKILLLFAIPLLVIFVIAVAISFFFFSLNMQEITIDIILLPLDIIAGIYMAIVFLNTFLFCRAQYKPQAIESEIN